MLEAKGIDVADGGGLFDVGETVYRVHNGTVMSRDTVSRVTAKFAYVQRGSHESKYDRSTGAESPRRSGFGSERIARPDDRLDAEFRASLRRSAARALSDAAMEAAREVEGAAEKVSKAYERWVNLAQ